MPKFGPAGNSDSFFADGNKSLIQAPGWVARQGLDAYEVQFGRGVRSTEASATAFGAKAQQHNIAVSIHAPYYISLASVDPQKRENSIRYILESAQAVSWMGGNRIVVHPGGLGGLSREGATELAIQTLQAAQVALDENGLSHVHICPETMGKINQLGDLHEVMQMCKVDERFLPCIDFGHLNSRTHGEVNSEEAFESIYQTIYQELGEERAQGFHSHFSKIEYSAGGEKRHLTFADTVYGPEPMALLEVLYRHQSNPTIICESSGTQAEDALAMKNMFQSII